MASFRCLRTLTWCAEYGDGQGSHLFAVESTDPFFSAAANSLLNASFGMFLLFLT